MSHETTRHMQVGGQDYRQRLTLTFVPGRERRYKEIYCFNCTQKILETYDELAYVSDVDDISLQVTGQPSAFGVPCKGRCHNWYEIKTVPGVFDVEVTKIFFVDPSRKRREVHCYLCKELFCTVSMGLVYGLRDPYTSLKSDTNGFVPTFCPGRKCEHEYELTT